MGRKVQKERKRVACLYKRVSSARQVMEGDSLQVQERKLRAYAEVHDLEPIVVADEGITGSSIDKRPGIQRVMEMIQAGEITDLVVSKLDRLGRNVREGLEIVEHCVSHGVEIHCLQESINTRSSTGKLFITIILALAEWERATTQERVSEAMADRKARGLKCGGYEPYGFCAIDGVLEPVEEEQQVVRLIHRHKRKGKSANKIAELLNKKGIPTKKNRLWRARQILNVLRYNTA